MLEERLRLEVPQLQVPFPGLHRAHRPEVARRDVPVPAVRVHPDHRDHAAELRLGLRQRAERMSEG
jgi:hypothetical protein